MNDRDDRPGFLPAPRGRRGFSVVELLIVLSIMGILAAIALPHFSPSLQGQLKSAAEVVASDLSYARNLAITNNSTYELAFDFAANRYTLQHTGGNTLLDALPPSPFHHPDDPPDQQITDFARLPHMGAVPRLATVNRMTSTPEQVTNIEFGPLGETTRSEESIVWLKIGSGASEWFIPIRVDPVTGLAIVGELQSTSPPLAAAVIVAPQFAALSPGASSAPFEYASS